MRPEVKAYIDRAAASTAGIPEDMVDIYQALLQAQGKELNRIAEQTSTANIDRVANVFIPAIKKLSRDSILNRVVGVQPIPDRIAIVKFIDYVYTQAYATDGVAAGDSAIDKVSKTFSNDPGEGQNISRSLDFVIREEGVTARQRKMAGRWTFEAGDATSKDGINLETEITKALSAKITEEVNFEILGDLYDKASGGSVSWTAPLAADAASVKDRKEKELFYTVLDVAASIYEKTRRYPNYVVCNPKVAAYFKRSGDYIAPTAENGQVALMKRLFVTGTLNDEFAVHVVPNLGTDKILVGYKGPSELECGALYAPYIPLVIMDSFFNTENWTWLRSVGSFYAKSFPMTDLYGIVNVSYT